MSDVLTANLFDKEEIIENCTVQILTNTVTGEQSVGWWRGTKDDMPRFAANEPNGPDGEA